MIFIAQKFASHSYNYENLEMQTFKFLIVGPVASALTNRYGCRKVTVVGAVVASSGFLLSLFAPNIYYLYVTFGILSGKTNCVLG